MKKPVHTHLVEYKLFPFDVKILYPLKIKPNPNIAGQYIE